MFKTLELPGGFAPLAPLPGLCPGPTGGLKWPPDPSPNNFAPPISNSWLRPWGYFHKDLNKPFQISVFVMMKCFVCCDTLILWNSAWSIKSICQCVNYIVNSKQNIWSSIVKKKQLKYLRDQNKFTYILDSSLEYFNNCNCVLKYKLGRPTFGELTLYNIYNIDLNYLIREFW